MELFTPASLPNSLIVVAWTPFLANNFSAACWISDLLSFSIASDVSASPVMLPTQHIDDNINPFTFSYAGNTFAYFLFSQVNDIFKTGFARHFRFFTEVVITKDAPKAYIDINCYLF